MIIKVKHWNLIVTDLQLKIVEPWEFKKKRILVTSKKKDFILVELNNSKLNIREIYGALPYFTVARQVFKST